MNNLKFYKNLGMQTQQLLIIEKALKANIPHSFLKKYFCDTRYSALQLEIILNAILNDLNVALLADIDIPHQKMEEIYLSLLEEKKLKEDEKMRQELIKNSKKGIKISYIIFIVLSIAFSLLLVIYVGLPLYKLYKQPLELVLKQDNIKIKYGAKIAPETLIKSYSKADNINLNIPYIDTTKLGNTSYKYTLTNGFKKINKQVMVMVYDDIKPVLKLDKNNLSISKKDVDNFKCETKVIMASDNVDGDISKNVKCKNTVKDDKLLVDYEIIDSSKNKTIDNLTFKIITINDDPPRLQAPDNARPNTDSTITEAEYYKDKQPIKSDKPFISGISDFSVPVDTPMKDFIHKLSYGVKSSGWVSIDYSDVNLSSKDTYEVRYFSDDGAKLSIYVTVY